MDLHWLQEVTSPGPFATIYLDASHDTEDAARAGELRWQEVRAELAESGADPATVQALEEALRTAPPPIGRAGRVLVASGGRVLLHRVLPEPPDRQRAAFGVLPDLVPMLAALPEAEPVVVAVVDRTGGELRGYDAGHRLVEEPVVQGSEFGVHKPRGGGWSHRRIQQHVQETWRENVAEVADAVDKLVAELGARLVVVAGDVTARALLTGALSRRAAEIAVEVPAGSRAEGSEDAEAALQEEIDRLLAERARSRCRDAFGRFAAERARSSGLAAGGVSEVIGALRKAKVATLLLDAHRLTDDAPLWIAPDPVLVGRDEGELRALGVEHPEPAPAGPALLRAAIASGADLYVAEACDAEDALPDGVGALLRYA